MKHMHSPQHDERIGNMIHLNVVHLLELLVRCGHEHESSRHEKLLQQKSELQKETIVIRRTHERGQMAECVYERNSRVLVVKSESSVAVSVAVH